MCGCVVCVVVCVCAECVCGGTCGGGGGVWRMVVAAAVTVVLCVRVCARGGVCMCGCCVSGNPSGGGAHVVAVDIPSGLSGGRATVAGAAVHADATVTFMAPKIPHLFSPAESFCGDLVVAGIGIPEEAVDDEGVWLEWVDEDSLAGRLPPRDDDSHKGDYGHVLVVGGSVMTALLGRKTPPAAAARAGLE